MSDQSRPAGLLSRPSIHTNHCSGGAGSDDRDRKMTKMTHTSIRSDRLHQAIAEMDGPYSPLAGSPMVAEYCYALQ